MILREWSVYRVRAIPQKEQAKFIRGEELPDVLMETTTDKMGQFSFHEVPAPAFPNIPEVGKSVYPWDIVALAGGHGLAWVQLTPHYQRTPITLKLAPKGSFAAA